MAPKTKTEIKAGPSTEQLQRVMGLQEKLLEVALEESDPDGWMSAEKAEEEAQEYDRLAAQADADGAADLAKLHRAEAAAIRKGWKGQRYWEKKNATATVSLLTKLEMYRQRIEEGRQAGKGNGSAIDPDKEAAEIKAAEKKVQARLSLVKKRAC